MGSCSSESTLTAHTKSGKKVAHAIEEMRHKNDSAKTIDEVKDAVSEMHKKIHHAKHEELSDHHHKHEKKEKKPKAVFIKNKKAI